jgi:amino acid permease
MMQEAAFLLPSFAFAVIVAFPFPTAFTFPADVTVATFLLLLLQVSDLFPAVDGVIVAFRFTVLPVCNVTDVLLNLIFVILLLADASAENEKHIQSRLRNKTIAR